MNEAITPYMASMKYISARKLLMVMQIFEDNDIWDLLKEKRLS